MSDETPCPAPEPTAEQYDWRTLTAADRTALAAELARMAEVVRVELDAIDECRCAGCACRQLLARVVGFAQLLHRILAELASGQPIAASTCGMVGLTIDTLAALSAFGVAIGHQHMRNGGADWSQHVLDHVREVSVKGRAAASAALNAQGTATRATSAHRRERRLWGGATHRRRRSPRRSRAISWRR